MTLSLLARRIAEHYQLPDTAGSVEEIIKEFMNDDTDKAKIERPARAEKGNMSAPKRYANYGPALHEAPEGFFVAYSDYTALREQLDDLTAPKSMAQITLETGTYNVPPNVMLAFNQLRAEVERLQEDGARLDELEHLYSTAGDKWWNHIFMKRVAVVGFRKAVDEIIAARAAEKGKTT